MGIQKKIIWLLASAITFGSVLSDGAAQAQSFTRTTLVDVLEEDGDRLEFNFTDLPQSDGRGAILQLFTRRGNSRFLGLDLDDRDEFFTVSLDEFTLRNRFGELRFSCNETFADDGDFSTLPVDRVFSLRNDNCQFRETIPIPGIGFDFLTADGELNVVVDFSNTIIRFFRRNGVVRPVVVRNGVGDFGQRDNLFARLSFNAIETSVPEPGIALGLIGLGVTALGKRRLTNSQHS